MKNDEITILKAFAIMLVVSGHLHYTLIRSLPTYAFHMALFFFISGMLFNENYKFLTYLKRRLKSLIIPYYLYNLAYIPITFIIYKITGTFYGSSLTLYNFVIQPFFTGPPLHLCLSLWFVLQLFISLICYWVLHKVKFNNIFLYFLFACIAVFLGNKNENMFLLLVYRTIFSLFFIHLGYIYYSKKINIFSPKLIVIFYPLILCMFFRKYLPYINEQGILNYSFVDMDFNKLWVPILPIVSSLTGIYFSLSFIKIIYKYIHKINFINLIGNNTYHIMANHILIANIITCSILSIKGISFDITNSDLFYSYNIEKYKWVYFIAGVTIPVIICQIYTKIYQFFKNSQIHGEESSN